MEDKYYRWQDNLKTGDIVEARFTNSYDYYNFKAKVLKVNLSSFNVQPLEPVYPKEDYTQRRFNIVRLNINTFNRWSVNNGLFPLKEAKNI